MLFDSFPFTVGAHTRFSPTGPKVRMKTDRQASGNDSRRGGEQRKEEGGGGGNRR